MSSSSYESYSISAAELRRMEEEAKRRMEEERKRQEEERRRREEEKRKKEVAEVKERIVAMKKLQEIGRELHRREQEKAIMTKASVKAPTTTAAGKDKSQMLMEKKAAMIEMAHKIREQLARIPAEWEPMLGNQRARFQKTLEDIERAGFDTFDYNRLESLRMYVNQYVCSAADRYIDWERKRETLQRDGDRLFAIIQSLVRRAPEENQKRDAALMLERLQGLFAQSSLDRAFEGVAVLNVQAQRLSSDVEKAIQQELAKNKVIDNVRDVLLNEMGYDVIEVRPPSGQAAVPGVKDLYFRTPDGEAVRISMGRDNTMRQEFMLLHKSENDTLTPEAAAVEKCRRWCKDHAVLGKKLSAHGIFLRTNWRQEPEKGNFAAIMQEGSASPALVDEEDDFYAYERPEYRRP
ncbi:MAG: hypothetical protein SCK29_12920 [Bacillota bacterium]|nr:hypothetical protein [Bacillota bacterium]MDW7685002.1 hypothetical protein [Bacillota bacterium]